MKWSRIFALVVLAFASSAWAEANPYLQQAKVYHQGLDFERCLQRLEHATRWKNSTKTELAEIELYSGVCKLQLGQSAEEAADHFQLAIQLNPEIQLPALTSPKVSKVFDEVAAKVRPSVQPTQTADKPADGSTAQAPAAAVATKTEAPKRDYLVSNILVGSGAAVTVVGVGLGFWAKSTADKAKESRDPVEKPELRSSASSRALMADVAVGVGLAAVAGGLVMRFLPTSPDAPQVAIGPTGVSARWSFGQ